MKPQTASKQWCLNQIDWLMQGIETGFKGQEEMCKRFFLKLWPVDEVNLDAALAEYFKEKK